MDRQSRYTELLKRHLPMVWRGCWVRARGNYERCRDLVQEVSIALWLHLDQLRTDVSPKEEKAWVWWMTRTTLDHLHRSQQLPLQALTEAIAETIPDADNSAVEEDIEELMAALSPEEQQLVRLHIEGYRADEIAETLGLGRDTVYQRMHRALGKARKVLLVLFLLLVASTVAIAVVPQWRQRVFGGGEPAVEETLPVSVPAALSPAPSVVGDSIGDTVVTRRTWIPPEPLSHLVTVADTVLRSLRRYRRGAAGRGSRCDHPCGGEQHRGGRRQGRTCRCLRFSRAPGGHSAVQRPLHAHHRDAGPLLFTNHYFRNQRLLGTSGRPPAAAGLHQATPPRESDTSYPCLNPADIHVLIHII